VKKQKKASNTKFTLLLVQHPQPTSNPNHKQKPTNNALDIPLIVERGRGYTTITRKENTHKNAITTISERKAALNRSKLISLKKQR
jgi:hypothetical protein